MNLKHIGSNQTELTGENGVVILFSYSTPVAAFVPGRGGLATRQFFSRTTSKHITLAMNRWACSKTLVEQGEIETLLSQQGLDKSTHHEIGNGYGNNS